MEWVGYCADGDGCARYRCRSCGEYWLGTEVVHQCVAAVPDLEQQIDDWVALALDRLIESQAQASAVERDDHKHPAQRQTAQMMKRNVRIRARAYKPTRAATA